MKNLDLGEEIVTSTDGYLIFDDTVINKKYSEKIELVWRQYSGNEHQVVRGIIEVWPTFLGVSTPRHMKSGTWPSANTRFVMRYI